MFSTVYILYTARCRYQVLTYIPYVIITVRVCTPHCFHPNFQYTATILILLSFIMYYTTLLLLVISYCLYRRRLVPFIIVIVVACQKHYTYANCYRYTAGNATSKVDVANNVFCDFRGRVLCFVYRHSNIKLILINITSLSFRRAIIVRVFLYLCHHIYYEYINVIISVLGLCATIFCAVRSSVRPAIDTRRFRSNYHLSTIRGTMIADGGSRYYRGVWLVKKKLHKKRIIFTNSHS